MKDTLETMPIFGKMRKNDPRLTFGQYLTILKEWHDSIKEELRERLTKHDCTEDVCLFSKLIKEILGEK